jgi:hypothetical protein
VNLSDPFLDTISGVVGVLLVLVLPIWLVRWLVRKAEPEMPPAKSVAGVVVRTILALVLAAGFLITLVVGMVYWPPRAFTQMKVRAVVAERVKELGGWEEVAKECDQLMQRPNFQDYNWYSPSVSHHPPRNSSDSLPVGLAALKPRSVRVTRYGTTQWMVDIFLHKPWPHRACGIRVICDAPTNAPALPQGARVPVVLNGRQLADRVYEF